MARSRLMKRPPRCRLSARRPRLLRSMNSRGVSRHLKCGWGLSMRSVETRLEQIEKQLGKATCVCSEPEHLLAALVVIKDDWGPEQIERAAASVRFTCPTHGVQSPPILRFSEADARL